MTHVVDPALRKRAPIKAIVLRPDAMQRFLARFAVVGDCWIWTGATCSGYGSFRQGRGQRYAAHRVAYTLFKGEIPQGKQIDHLCRVRNCVNPDHLELVTNKENIARAPWTAIQLQRAKTHCLHGHPYDQANTYHYNGERHCRACRRDAAQRKRDLRRDPEQGPHRITITLHTIEVRV